MRYVASTLALVNSSAGCYKELTKSDVQTDNTVRTSCIISEPPRTKLWEKGQCFSIKDKESRVDLFKIINKDGYNHLYCYPHRIRTNTEEAFCPPYPFKLPDEESFTTDTHVYISERKPIRAGLWDIEIATSKINYKFKTHMLPVVLEEYEPIKGVV